MNIDLINRLKTNENPHRIFADMTAEEQECLKEVERKNCQYLDYAMSWIDLDDEGMFCRRDIYRINPFYQPESAKTEYIDLPVYKSDLGNLMVDCQDGSKIYIDDIVHRSDFRDFVDVGRNHTVFLDSVARRVAEGCQIIARFEKGE